jgi:DNA-directed RNA polymerase subunit RPC12/RpoP
VRIFGSNVVLSRGGRSVTVKFYELIEADQQHLRELLASRGQEAMIPPRTSGGDLAGPELDVNNVPAAASSNNSRSSSSSEDEASSDESEPLSPRSGYDPARVPSPAPDAPASSSSSSGYNPRAAAGWPAGMPPGMGTPPTGSTTGGSSSPYSTSNPMPGYSPSPSPSYGGSSQPYGSRVNPLVINQPSGSSYGENVVGTCSHCRREITQSQSTAANCPHCGIRWSYKQDPVTRQNLPIPRLTAPTVQFDPQTSRAIGIVVGVLIGLIVVVGLIIGTMYAVMGLASISSSNRDTYRP